MKMTTAQIGFAGIGSRYRAPVWCPAPAVKEEPG
jgi:hypothetical protein